MFRIFNLSKTETPPIATPVIVIRPFTERLNKIHYNLDNLPSCFTCPLTYELLEEPCMLNHNPRYNFEKSDLEKWLNNNNQRHPIYNIRIESLALNPALKQKIEKFVSTLESIANLQSQLNNPAALIAENIDYAILNGLSQSESEQFMIEQNEAFLMNIQSQLIEELKIFINFVTETVWEDDASPEDNKKEILEITNEFVLTLYALESELGRTPPHLFDVPDLEASSEEDNDSPTPPRVIYPIMSASPSPPLSHTPSSQSSNNRHLLFNPVTIDRSDDTEMERDNINDEMSYLSLS